MCLTIVSCSGSPPAQNSKPVLSDYPKLFEKEAMVVVGKNASQVELESAEAIAAKLEELTGNKPTIRNELVLVEGDRVGHDLILIGIPNSNDMLEQIYTLTGFTRVTTEYPGKNKGILAISRSPWQPNKTLLIIAGSDQLGVKAASEELTSDEKVKELTGEMMVTEFTEGQEQNATRDIPSNTLNTLNTIMDYIRQHHPDAATFIKKNMSWNENSNTIRPGYTGYTSLTYSGDGWTVTISHSVTAEIIYDVRAEYQGLIVWVGTIKDGVITETSYMAK